MRGRTTCYEQVTALEALVWGKWKLDERKPQVSKSRNFKLDWALLMRHVQFQISGFRNLRFPFVQFPFPSRQHVTTGSPRTSAFLIL